MTAKNIETKTVRLALYVNNNINDNKQLLSTPKKTAGPIDQPYCSTQRFKITNNITQAKGLKK
jgi:hypothetical protein